MSGSNATPEDLRNWVVTAFRQAGVPVTSSQIDQMIRQIHGSIQTYQNALQDRSTPDEGRRALRGLLALLERDDPPVGQIRQRVQTLPSSAKRWLQRRASTLLRRETQGMDHFSDWFSRWVADAPSDKLIPGLRTLAVEGGKYVKEHSGDQPARRQLKPMIMGVVDEANDNPSKGGRPANSLVDDLVMHLAVDWQVVTNKDPALIRSEANGFPGLVHRVFELFEIEASAAVALRRYGEAFRREKARDHQGRGGKPPADPSDA